MCSHSYFVLRKQEQKIQRFENLLGFSRQNSGNNTKMTQHTNTAPRQIDRPKRYHNALLFGRGGSYHAVSRWLYA